MVIVHEHGIMDMQVQFCQCATAIEEPYQLIQANLWPATWITPHTVTTIGALRAYEGLSHYANVNVHDYLKHLKNTTNLTFAHTVKVRCAVPIWGIADALGRTDTVNSTCQLGNTRT